MSIEEFKNLYPDPEWRKKYVDFCDLVRLLGDCIISDKYQISDALNQTIQLSPEGNELLGKLTRRDKVNPKDARLMCALTIGHDKLFVDVNGIDIESIASAINSEIKSNAIRFPLTYGRDLYDAYAELFEEEKELLTMEETTRLLDKLEIGVFQYGRFTTGPFGLQPSLSSRNITSGKHVRAYHCARPICHDLHPVLLQTSEVASINKDREKIRAALQERQEDPNDWEDFSAQLSGLSASFFNDHRSGVLLPLIGDVLSDRELRELIIELLDNTQGSLREAVEPLIGRSSASSMVASLNRAQMLQISIIAKEQDVHDALDRLIAKDAISIPLGDVRRAIIGHEKTSGAFRLRAELGHYGVRHVSLQRGHALLRLKRLLNKLYLREPEAQTDIQELEWQLRGVDIEDLDERLEYFFKNNSPEDALRRLALARRSNVIAACHEAGIEHFDTLSDNELIEALLWKLGFNVATGEDPHRDFWSEHERLSALTQSSEIGHSSRFREAAAPLFSSLEGLLLDSLAFITWALLVDHTRNAHPFSYDNHEARREGLALLQGVLPKSESLETDYLSEKVTLKPLIDGFSTLAKHLEGCLEQREMYERASEEFPEYDGKTDLKVFKFRSTIPFLDLSAPSQKRIIDGLRSITSTMLASDVCTVRNDYSHYRRTLPDIKKVEDALEAVRVSVKRIENLGFCRLTYRPTDTRIDAWGQSSHIFSGPRSAEHIFTRPTSYDWLELPSLQESQYLVRAASFEDPNEVLRFSPRHPSEFSEIWAEFPNRRRRGNRTITSDDAPEHKASADISAG